MGFWISTCGPRITGVGGLILSRLQLELKRALSAAHRSLRARLLQGATSQLENLSKVKKDGKALQQATPASPICSGFSSP